MNKKTMILLSLFIAILLTPFIFWKAVTYFDRPIVEARQMYKFGEGNEYIIIKSKLWQDKELVYAIIKEGESQDAGALSYRWIGESSVSLEEYTGKKIYLEAEYYTGKPILLNETYDNVYGIKNEQPVIRIKSIRLAE